MEFAEVIEVVSVRLRIALLRCLEVAFRMPGLLLFEIWWRNRNVDFSTNLLKESFSSYLEMDGIIEFIQTRNFDKTAAQILSYSTLLLSLLFILLPTVKLLAVYLHMLSILLFGVAHYLSSQYVLLEQHADPVLKLDDFSKLERHGFQILAQLMLCVAQSCLLGLENDFARVSIAVFLIPVIARMCALPVHHLMLAHNVACSLAMLFMCIYVLNRVPAFLISLRQSVRFFRTAYIIHGLRAGAVSVCRRLRLTELLVTSWLTMFVVRIYVHVVGKNRGINEAGAIFLSSVAESINTPISLLALALTVNFICKMIVVVSEYLIVGRYGQPHVLSRNGCMEGLILTLLCAQIGLLGMPTEQKAFLLGLVLFIVVSSLLQTLFELLERYLLTLASSRSASRSQHAFTIVLTLIVLTASLATSAAIAQYLPLDLWCVIIVSNCLLTTVRIFSAAIIYAIVLIDELVDERLYCCEELTYRCCLTSHILEMLISVAVLAFGIFNIISGQFTLASTVVLICYAYYNVWQRLREDCQTVWKRKKAKSCLESFLEVPPAVLMLRGDSCVICLHEMTKDARMTPCKHTFHSSCLLRWLYIKQVCPLCYAKIPIELEILTSLMPSRNDNISTDAYILDSDTLDTSSETSGSSDGSAAFSEYTMNGTESESDQDVAIFYSS